MEVDDLFALLTVANLRSFSRAAETLGLTQPTLSKRIARAETALGLKVLDRAKRPISPTSRGFNILQRIGLAVEILRENQSSSSNIGTGDSVVVAATDELTSTLILGTAAAFHRKLPGVALKIVSSDDEGPYGLLEREKVDIAILHTAPRGRDLDFEPLFLFERVLLTPRGHVLDTKQDSQITWEDIATFPLVLTSPRIQNHRMLEDELAKREIPYRIALEVRSSTLVTKAVSSGLGISVVGNTSALLEDQGSVTTKNLSHLMPRDVGGIAYRQGRPLSNATQAFMHELTEFCKNRSGLPVPDFKRETATG